MSVLPNCQKAFFKCLEPSKSSDVPQFGLKNTRINKEIKIEKKHFHQLNQDSNLIFPQRLFEKIKDVAVEFNF